MSNYSRRTWLTLCGLATTIAVLGMYYACARQPKPQLQGRIAMTVGTPLVAPIVYADAKRLWASEEMEVKLEKLLLGRAALDAVLGGHADVATVAETPIVLASARGIALEILCVISSSDQHVHVAARRDHGILNPKDLEGKTIATAVGTNNEYYLRQFLDRNGVSFSKIKLVNYDPAEMSRALTGGVIDGAAFWNPYLDDSQSKLGEKLIVFPSGDYYTVYYSLVARKGFAAANPELARKLVRVLRRASNQMASNPGEAIPVVAAALPLRESLLRIIWGGYRFQVSFPNGFTEEMLQQADWLGQKDPAAAQRAKRVIPTLDARIPE